MSCLLASERSEAFSISREAYYDSDSRLHRVSRTWVAYCTGFRLVGRGFAVQGQAMLWVVVLVCGGVSLFAATHTAPLWLIVILLALILGRLHDMGPGRRI